MFVKLSENELELLPISDWRRYPWTDIRWGTDGPEFTTVTRWDVARNCMGRVFYFGCKNSADKFVHEEFDLALHLMGVGDYA